MKSSQLETLTRHWSRTVPPPAQPQTTSTVGRDTSTIGPATPWGKPPAHRPTKRTQVCSALSSTGGPSSGIGGEATLSALRNAPRRRDSGCPPLPLPPRDGRPPPSTPSAHPLDRPSPSAPLSSSPAAGRLSSSSIGGGWPPTAAAAGASAPAPPPPSPPPVADVHTRGGMSGVTPRGWPPRPPRSPPGDSPVPPAAEAGRVIRWHRPIPVVWPPSVRGGSGAMPWRRRWACGAPLDNRGRWEKEGADGAGGGTSAKRGRYMSARRTDERGGRVRWGLPDHRQTVGTGTQPRGTAAADERVHGDGKNEGLTGCGGGPSRYGRTAAGRTDAPVWGADAQQQQQRRGRAPERAAAHGCWLCGRAKQGRGGREAGKTNCGAGGP